MAEKTKGLEKDKILFLMMGIVAFIATAIPARIIEGVGNTDGLTSIGVYILYGAVVIAALFSMFFFKLGVERIVIEIGILVLTALSIVLHFNQSGIMFLVLLGVIGILIGIIEYLIQITLLYDFKSKHFNFLHIFSGVGFFLGTLIYSLHEMKLVLQIAIFVLAGIAMIINVVGTKNKEEGEENKRKKNKKKKNKEENPNKREVYPLLKCLNQYGVGQILFCCFLYYGIQNIIALWGQEYMVEQKGYTATSAQFLILLFYILLFGVRIVSSIILTIARDKIATDKILQYGQIIAIFGILLLFIPGFKVATSVGFILMGVGMSPIYPNLLYQNKAIFKKKSIPVLLGIEIAAATVGLVVIPLLFEVIAVSATIEWLPLTLLCMLVIMTAICESLNTNRVKQIENQAVVDALVDQYVLIGIVGNDEKMFRFVKDDFALLSTGVDSFASLVETISYLIGDKQKKEEFIKQFNMSNLKKLRKAGTLNVEEELCLDIAGEEYWVSFMVHATNEKSIAYTFALKNIAEFHKYQEMGLLDYATGLLNRNSYLEKLDLYGDQSSEGLSVVYIDINNLHEMNNKFGHAAGDAIIHTAGLALKECFGEETCYRIGGDEFVVIVKMDIEDVRTRMNLLTYALEKKYVSLSFGVAAGNKFSNLNEIVQIADDMMLTEKAEYHRIHDEEE